MKIDKWTLVLLAITFMLASLTGALYGLRATDAKRITQLEADLRYWKGKAVFAEDKVEDEMNDLRGQLALAAFEAQACKDKK